MSTREVLPPTPASPARARALVRAQMEGFSEEAVTAVELMTSELVTNAVVHGSSSIEVELRQEAVIMRVAVTDGCQERPVPKNPHERDPHGRGLLIVQSLAEEWGVVENQAGKSVWFTLACQQAGSQLPQEAADRSQTSADLAPFGQ